MAIHRIPISFQAPPYQFTTSEYPGIKSEDTLVLYDQNDGHEVDATITDIILGSYIHFRINYATLRPIDGWEPNTVGAGAPLRDRIEEILEEEYGSQGGKYSQVAEKILGLLAKDTRRVVFDTGERRDIHPFTFLERSNSYLHREEEFEYHEVDTFHYVQRVQDPRRLFDDWAGIMDKRHTY